MHDKWNDSCKIKTNYSKLKIAPEAEICPISPTLGEILLQ